LVKNIVNHNHPVLREIVPSYRKQIETAVRRDDWVSINHRVVALMASYFDIIFAVNRIPHPGEKRQLEHALRLCETLPIHFGADIKGVLQNTTTSHIIEAIHTLMNHFDMWLREKSLI